MVSPTVTPYSGLEDVAKYVLNILYTCIYSIMMGGYFHLFSVVDIVNGLIAFLARKGPLSTKVLRMTIKLLLEKKKLTLLLKLLHCQQRLEDIGSTSCGNIKLYKKKKKKETTRRIIAISVINQI